MPIIGLPGGSDGKEYGCNLGDPGSIPGSGRSPGEGHGNPLQCSCLESPHGQKSLVSCWGRKESDMTEQLTHTQQALQSSLIHTKVWEAPEQSRESSLRVSHLHIKKFQSSHQKWLCQRKINFLPLNMHSNNRSSSVWNIFTLKMLWVSVYIILIIPLL